MYRLLAHRFRTRSIGDTISFSQTSRTSGKPPECHHPMTQRILHVGTVDSSEVIA
jgi:hypothetical protein